MEERDQIEVAEDATLSWSCALEITHDDIGRENSCTVRFQVTLDVFISN